MAILMTDTVYCMSGSSGGVLLLDILAGLYIFSVFFVILWYEEEKRIQNPVYFAVTQTCFNWNLARYAHLHASPLC